MAIYGDTSGTLSGHQKGKGQQLKGTGGIYGDARPLDGDARGGNDVLVVAAGGSFSELFGDAHSMQGDARGGNDTLQGALTKERITLPKIGCADMCRLWSGTQSGVCDWLLGGASSENQLYGGAMQMWGDTRGGNDVVVGGSESSNYLIGDAAEMMDHAIGGNDQLVGGISSYNSIRGDAVGMSHSTHGGNDEIRGGDFSTNTLIGDADLMYAGPGLR